MCSHNGFWTETILHFQIEYSRAHNTSTCTAQWKPHTDVRTVRIETARQTKRLSAGREGGK